MYSRTSTTIRPCDEKVADRIGRIQRVVLEIEQILNSIRRCPAPCTDGTVCISPPSGKARREMCPVISVGCEYGKLLKQDLDVYLIGVMAQIGIPERHLQNFKDIKHTDAMKAANQWFFTGAPKGYLVMSGVPGVGKSFGAAYAVYLHLKNRINGWMVKENWRNAARAVDRTAWATAQEIVGDKALAGRSRSADLLVLDDFGKEFANNTAQTTICDVICRRYDDRKPTVVTTELAMPDITNRYGRYISERFGEDVKAGGKLVLCRNESMRFEQAPQTTEAE